MICGTPGCGICAVGCCCWVLAWTDARAARLTAARTVVTERVLVICTSADSGRPGVRPTSTTSIQRLLEKMSMELRQKACHSLGAENRPAINALGHRRRFFALSRASGTLNSPE